MDSSSHSFSVEVAKVVGVEGAVLLAHFSFWHKKNMGNNHNFRDGMYWTYNTLDALQIQFPYLTLSQLRTQLGHLKKRGLVAISNPGGKNRTSWYALTESGCNLLGIPFAKIHKCKVEIPQIDLPDLANANANSDKCNCENSQMNNKDTDLELTDKEQTDSLKNGANNAPGADAQSLDPNSEKNEEADAGKKTAKRSKKPPRVAPVPPEVSPDQFVYQTKKDEFAVIDWPVSFTPVMRNFYLNEWLPYHLNRSGKRLTEQGVKQQLADLTLLNETQALDCLKKSISFNWTGFFVDKYLLTNGTPQNPNAAAGQRPNYGAGATLPPGSNYTKQSFRRPSDRNRTAEPAEASNDSRGNGDAGSRSPGGI